MLVTLWALYGREAYSSVIRPVAVQACDEEDDGCRRPSLCTPRRARIQRNLLFILARSVGMRDHRLDHRHVPQARPAHVHRLLVFEHAVLDLGADVREARDTVDACCALVEVDCFAAVAGLGCEGFCGEGFGGGEEVGGVGVVVGVVDVVLGRGVSG